MVFVLLISHLSQDVLATNQSIINKRRFTDPWCIGGDFNVVRFPGERTGASRLSSAMRRFTKVIDDLQLRDLPLLGGSFTWSGGLNNKALSRLDRVLVSKEWEGHFSGVMQCILPRPVSNHSLILLDVGGLRRGPSPLGLKNMWLKEEGFKDLGEVLVGTLSFKEETAKEASRVEFPNGLLWRKQAGDTRTRAPYKGHELRSLSIQDATKLEEPFVKEAVFNALSALNGASILRLVLVPKKGGTKDLKDIRPISLVGGLYKLLAKVSANWLKKMVSKVVSNFHNAFVEDRQILDVVLIANRAIDSMLKSNRELRPRDPLSPYLFVLTMEALSYFLRRAREGGFLASFKVNGRDGEGLEVTHLLFVDDILVFCEVSRAQMTYLSWLLMWFEVISNMKINLTKSEFILIGSVEDLALEIGCKVGCSQPLIWGFR
ncbi:hypothetical protein CK203_027280 [Vitis vinifera]|uniref:Endonuclease/exonuclease/phosphatase domain-containing protein n=1 Tax=Vitis vinifera TaxID=29760 RepID=A0A438J9L2_VITVI|nr:hypothetical protein CK203_027280 [Vitis vinifera]